MERKKTEITINQRRAVFASLSEFDYMSKESDYIELVEWTNGEGIDVNIYNNGAEQRFSLTYGQISALNTCNNILKLGGPVEVKNEE